MGFFKACWTVTGILALLGCGVFSNHTVVSGPPRRNYDLNLHYVIRGEGSPMLFLHGFGAHSYTWNQIADPLSRNNRLILLDLKGHGASPKPVDKAYSLREHANLVKDFIVKQNLHHLTLVGHSLGGGVALLATLGLIATEPSRISRLILIDAVAYPQKFPLFVNVLRIPVIASLVTYLIPTDVQVRHVLRLAYYDDSKITDEAVGAYAAPLSLPGGRHALIETARQIVPDDISEIIADYGTLNIPTLIIWGSHDRVIPIEHGKRLHGIIPGSELAVIDKSGHIPHEEMPVATLSVIENFIGMRKSQ
jgi:pimeloyl-ACP methyl ester carboxylesterase